MPAAATPEAAQHRALTQVATSGGREAAAKRDDSAGTGRPPSHRTLGDQRSGVGGAERPDFQLTTGARGRLRAGTGRKSASRLALHPAQSGDTRREQKALKYDILNLFGPGIATRDHQPPVSSAVCPAPD